MHYHAEVHTPNGIEDVARYVDQVMEPHREWYDDENDTSGGWWDWFQIGGRWTGEHDPDYDPAKDPRNHENCTICNGTGKRTDRIGEAARRDNPGYTCNGCGSDDTPAGIAIKWPTQRAEVGADVIPTRDCREDLTCHTLLVNGKALMVEEWTGKDFKKTDFNGMVRETLDSMGLLNTGKLVTVDYHC